MVPQLNLPNAKKDVPARLGGNLLPRLKTFSKSIFGQRCHPRLSRSDKTAYHRSPSYLERKQKVG